MKNYCKINILSINKRCKKLQRILKKQRRFMNRINQEWSRIINDNEIVTQIRQSRPRLRKEKEFRIYRKRLTFPMNYTRMKMTAHQIIENKNIEKIKTISVKRILTKICCKNSQSLMWLKANGYINLILHMCINKESLLFR